MKARLDEAGRLHVEKRPGEWLVQVCRIWGMVHMPRKGALIRDCALDCPLLEPGDGGVTVNCGGSIVHYDLDALSATGGLVEDGGEGGLK